MRKIWLLPIVTFGFLSLSCSHHKHYRKHKKSLARAEMVSVNKSKTKGWVHFQKTKEKKQVRVRAEITGLKPNQKYGFHIHQYGDCRDNGKNAGGHLNPRKTQHGSPDSEEHHLGDLGNLVADKKGKAVYDQVLKLCMYKVGGRSVIIHANPDDFTTQPAGNAGPYISCGVIGYVKGKKKMKKMKKMNMKDMKKMNMKDMKKMNMKDMKKPVEAKSASTTKVKPVATKPANAKPGTKSVVAKPATAKQAKPAVAKDMAMPAKKPTVKTVVTKPAVAKSAKPATAKTVATKPAKVAKKPKVKTVATKPAVAKKSEVAKEAKVKSVSTKANENPAIQKTNAPAEEAKKE